MAQIYRCDLCGSLDGQAGLRVMVASCSRIFGDYPPVKTHGTDFTPVEYDDLCLLCARTIVGLLEQRKADRK